MSSLFVFLFLGSLTALVWGLLSPRSLGRVLHLQTLSRLAAGVVFGVLTLGTLVAAGATAPPVQKTAPLNTPPVVAKQQQDVQGATSQVKRVTQTTPIPFPTSTQNDATLAKGQTKVVQVGVDGVQTTTYDVTYVNGKETSRTLVSQAVTTQPVTQIVANGTYTAPAPKPTPAPAPAPAPTPSCTGGYINVDGNCVPSPSNDPTGATAQCNDGTYSYSQNHSGTCSHHGGVARWL